MNRPVTIELLGFSEPTVKRDGSVTLPVHVEGHLVRFVASRKQWREVLGAVAAAVGCKLVERQATSTGSGQALVAAVAPPPEAPAHAVSARLTYPNKLPPRGGKHAVRHRWWDACLADAEERGESTAATARRLEMDPAVVRNGLEGARHRRNPKPPVLVVLP